MTTNQCPNCKSTHFYLEEYHEAVAYYSVEDDKLYTISSVLSPLQPLTLKAVCPKCDFSWTAASSLDSYLESNPSLTEGEEDK